MKQFDLPNPFDYEEPEPIGCLYGPPPEYME